MLSKKSLSYVQNTGWNAVIPFQPLLCESGTDGQRYQYLQKAIPAIRPDAVHTTDQTQGLV